MRNHPFVICCLSLLVWLGLVACSRPGPLPSQPLGDPQLRADRFVQATAVEAPDLTLDYSAVSIHSLEGFIAKTYDGGATSVPSEERQGDIGCYLGETIIKTVGGRWDSAGSAAITGVGQVDAVYPLSQVEKRFRDGVAASLDDFYRGLQAPRGELTRPLAHIHYQDRLDTVLHHLMGVN